MNKYLFVLIISITFVISWCSSLFAQEEQLRLFTDRDYCISGDTLWFKVLKSDNSNEVGNIVRVQLSGKNNNIISTVIKKIEGEWTHGFIPVPDSLSTGQYFLTVFQNSQFNSTENLLKTKSLLVYNRFEEEVESLELVNVEGKKTQFNTTISIETNKDIYKTRDRVIVNLDIGSDVETRSVVVKAGIHDPLAAKLSSVYHFNFKKTHKWIEHTAENDGFMLSGKVGGEAGILQSDVIVFLSIPGEIPYFDYYVTGKDGRFHFLLKEAFGKTEVVLQVVSRFQKEYFINYYLNTLDRVEKADWANALLTAPQAQRIISRIEADFVNKLFNGNISRNEAGFKLAKRFSTPFYGRYTERVIPSEFLELPDFREISRELLNGVRYREKNGEISLRMTNFKGGGMFYSEPFRLINGIPVFKNSLFRSLKSEDIDYIDLVQSDRVFGDIDIKGVLAVYLYDKSNSWMNLLPNIFRFTIDCIQEKEIPNYDGMEDQAKNIPDVRQVFYWNKLQTKNAHTLEFVLSDLKGEFEVTVEGLTTDKQPVKVSKIIKVQ